MTSSEGSGIDPNPEQGTLIDTTDGIIVVDAGAGTGKTFAITHRYVRLLEEGYAPDDILLITFTRNAAEEMRERILRAADAHPADLADAPITTFHALAKRILERHGFHAPRVLGLDAAYSSSTRVMEDDTRAKRAFRRFLHRFRTHHPEHTRWFQILRDPVDLLDLVKELASKGIVPTATGWFRDGEAHLRGNLDAFQTLFDEANTPEGNSQSPLRGSLGGTWRTRTFLPDAPTTEEVRGPRGTKAIDPSWAEDAFHEDREDLLAFVHEVYKGWMEHALARNIVDFSLLLVLAFALLTEDDEVRARVQRPQLMIDEFQDTSLIQYRLALLLAEEPNLCVVGDWKQSIYGFNYASVENIQRFQDRLHRLAQGLNEGSPRVHPRFEDAPVRTIEFTANYRSPQPILDIAEHALTLPATGSDTVDADAILEDVVHLRAQEDHGIPPRMEAHHVPQDAQPRLVLQRILDIVGDPTYTVVDDETEDARPPTLSDITILTRTRSFALELEEAGRDAGIPVAFEGGADLLHTDEAKLVLAWLRTLEDKHSEEGWAVILPHAGYTLEETRAFLGKSDQVDERRDKPADLWAFRQDLEDLLKSAGPAAVTHRILARYGVDDGFSAALVRFVDAAHGSERAPPGEVVRILEDALDDHVTVDVHDTPGGDVVTIRTIHGAKGLEDPIIILADLTENRFPNTSSGYPSPIRYDDPLGLRVTKTVADPQDRGLPFAYDRWQPAILHACLPTTYDEERRLLYVALTRAQHHLQLIGAAERPSRFLTGLAVASASTPVGFSNGGLRLPPLDPKDVHHHGPDDVADITDLQERARSLVHDQEDRRAPPLAIDPPQRKGRRRPMSVHDIVDTSRAGTARAGVGTTFGKQVHAFAARYAEGHDVEPTNQDERYVQEIIDDLDGTIRAEVPITLPTRIDGEDVLVQGTIDLLHEAPDGTIEIYDWKTTTSGAGYDTYRQQVRLYMEAVAGSATYEGHDVHGYVVWSEDGEVRGV